MKDQVLVKEYILRDHFIHDTIPLTPCYCISNPFLKEHLHST